ncbi:GNAT family N-acetyltransferase [Aquibium carbonis]|uniref:GNAT family N-acetyltransferase n=1 Tax=Aquibium carbonis TaxID=2495581 RepID=A0A429YXG8_9HYPH|nr:GNAT family N-acetyltransferase [Aquibium carbonis]RST86131.1 GNAT family N-acetyltransferase [Aquibium carbonis]
MPELAMVRRYEAAGFRAWPASFVQYDGTWVIRLTAGLPAKRLNSINPLDPGDGSNILDRIARAERRFDAYGRPLTFRISPLAGANLTRHLDRERWLSFSESIVMRLALDNAHLIGVMDQIPMKDIGRFVSAALQVHNMEPAMRPGLSEVIGSIEPEAGLFVSKEGDEPVATAICVQDRDLAGLFEVATKPELRGKGFGRQVVLSALKWARHRGAREAWLQVEADNAPAVTLYRSLGFADVYRYHYRRPQAS